MIMMPNLSSENEIKKENTLTANEMVWQAMALSTKPAWTFSNIIGLEFLSMNELLTNSRSDYHSALLK